MKNDPEIIEAEVDQVVTQDGEVASASQSKSGNNTGRKSARPPKPGLRARITIWLMRVMANPKNARYLGKIWWPLWFLLGIILFILGSIVGLVFLIYKFLAYLVRPYIELFSGNSRS